MKVQIKTSSRRDRTCEICLDPIGKLPAMRHVSSRPVEEWIHEVCHWKNHPSITVSLNALRGYIVQDI